ncbi:MAG: hypothetical protein, partial [Olavius algarvensis Gamma 1 endosymbiont]
GKAVGTYLEHKFTTYLSNRYEYEQGNSASGIDLPGYSSNTNISVFHSADEFEIVRQQRTQFALVFAR